MFMTTEILTAARLREVLNYEPETGAFTRLVPALMPNGSVRIPVGAVAGGINGDGYVVIKVCGKEHRAHRLAWLYVHGGWPSDEIDHIDGVRHNNRLSNLREASKSLNQQNQRRPRSDNTSGFLGVIWCGRLKKWRARIWHNEKSHHIGYFRTTELASAAYVAEKRRVHAGCTI